MTDPRKSPEGSVPRPSVSVLKSENLIVSSRLYGAIR